MRVRHIPVAVFAAVALIACSEGAARRVSKAPDALLGRKSEAMMAHLASVCPSGIRWVTEDRVHCKLGSLGEYPDWQWSNVAISFFSYDPEYRVESIDIEEHEDTRHLIRTFDQVVAPLVPAEIVGELRASIIARPAPVRRNEHAGSESSFPGLTEFSRMRGVLRVLWIRREVPRGDPPTHMEHIQWSLDVPPEHWGEFHRNEPSREKVAR